MYNAPSTDIIRLIPCANCTAPFDPSTLPAHVYDPYNAFFIFPYHSSICHSCFAEELAQRTRPPSRDTRTSGQRKSLERPSTSSDVVIRLSGSQLGEAEAFERSDSGAAFGSEAGQGIYSHRKTGSITTISRSASTSRLGTYQRPRSSMSSLPVSRRNSRSQPDLHRRGMSVDQIRKSMEAPVRTPRASPPQRYSPPTSSQPIPEIWQSQSTALPSTRPSTSRYSPQEMTATSVRYSPPTPSSATMGTQRPSTGHDSATLHGRKSTDTKESREARKDDMVRRKVSFRQGTPVPKAYHPMAPPLASSLPAGNDMSGIPLDNIIGRQSYEPEVAEAASDTAPNGFLGRWRIRRKEKREERARQKAVREERAEAKRVRDNAEKGIGVDIFCPSCRIVVPTVPDWTDGTCCVQVYLHHLILL
jgi:hypothetical protein